MERAAATPYQIGHSSSLKHLETDERAVIGDVMIEKLGQRRSC